MGWPAASSGLEVSGQEACIKEYCTVLDPHPVSSAAMAHGSQIPDVAQRLRRREALVSLAEWALEAGSEGELTACPARSMQRERQVRWNAVRPGEELQGPGLWQHLRTVGCSYRQRH